ncbi:MAG TPA: hypothetical protein VGR94_02120 [Candidatus Acidoferrales bacterium]|nr:hypothetical protein [Candidatus Acidoferrales bacterium]
MSVSDWLSISSPTLSVGLLVIIQRQPNPIVEVGLCPYGFGINVYKASVLSSPHDHGAATLPLQRGIVDGGINPAHDAFLAYANAHLSLNHEGNAAEHCFLLNAAIAC